MTALLEAEGVSVVREGRRLLDRVTFALAPGELATLEGASGSGKTTLLRALASLSPLDEGRVLLDGQDVVGLAPRPLRVAVAYVAQHPAMFDGTARDNVESGPRFRGATLEGGRVSELLAEVGLGGLEERAARDLSAGEKLRVGLARALANRPRALLLDEPTAALDPASRARVVALFHRLVESGTAVLVVTHVVEDVEALGGTRYRLDAGRLEAVVGARP